MTNQRISVLMVEDNPSEANLARYYLSRAGHQRFELRHVSSIRQALAELKQQARPDVVLLDLNLPDTAADDLSGFSRLHRLAPSLPIIILTNVDDEQKAAHLVREGAQDYLIKRDLNTSLLIRSIRYAIERQKHEDALRESEERYALAVAGANDGIWDWNLGTKAVYFSARWKALLGFAEDEIGDTIEEWTSRAHPEEANELVTALERHLCNGTTHFEHEHRLRHKEGHYVWVLARGLVVRSDDGIGVRMAGSLSDITPRKTAERQLIHDALHDSLTGLPNRSLYTDRLQQAMRRYARTHEREYAVLYCDLDRFKYVNDSMGHSAGDELLLAISERLSRILRPSDTLARLGGDEFAILLTDMEGRADAVQVAKRIHEQLEREFLIQGSEIFASASIGIALASERYHTPDEVLRDADVAMYRAKSDAATSHVIFDTNMHQHAVARLTLETDLRRALERQEFVVHYQPIVSVRSGCAIAFEALVRWNHPTRGLLYPDHFIQSAEETGLTVPLAWQVLETSIRQLRDWHRLYPDRGRICASVNITGKLFREPDLSGRLIALLSRYEVPPQSLRLEVTERAFMDHQEAALSELTKLRATGIKLYIDDFGTGYSSLSYLQRFSYDTLKIDKSFIQELGAGTENSAIVRALVDMCSTLDMDVIAEGVETADQLAQLQSMGCPAAQGFWFSRPMNAQQAMTWLESNREPEAHAVH